MFLHYLELAWRNTLAAKGLSALMVLALALGIGACMTTLTVYHVLSGDPIPHKSTRLFNVQLDASDMVGWKAGDEPTFDLSRFDATALLRDRKAMRQSMSSGFNTAVGLADGDTKPIFSSVRYTSADFFAMFDAPWQHGGGWSAADDEAEARVAVISASLNEKLFGGVNSVGREVIVRGQPLRVVGVLKPWKVQPHFWDLTQGSYTETEDFFLPFSTAMALKMGHWGNMDCWGRGANGGTSLDLNASCSWIQYWVEFEKPGDAAAYRDYLVAYSDAQRAAGRFERPTNVRLRNVMEWLGARRRAAPSEGAARRRAPADLAGLRLPGRLHRQHGRVAAGQDAAPQRRDRRSPRFGCHARRHLPAVRRRGRPAGPGRRAAGPAVRAGRPVAGAPEPQRLRPPGRAGRQHAGADAGPGAGGQPRRGPAAGLARGAGDAGRPTEGAVR
jgi:hypothetical protein